MAFTVTGLSPRGSTHFRCETVTQASTTAAEMARVGYADVSVTDAAGRRYTLAAFRLACGG